MVIRSFLPAGARSRRRCALALNLAVWLSAATGSVAQSQLGEKAACIPRGDVSGVVEFPRRVMYATLEAPQDDSPTLAIYLGTLLQEIALVYAAPDSAPDLPTYSFSLRLHRDGRLTGLQPLEAHVPTSLTEPVIRAIDSVSRRGGIGMITFDMDDDPLPLRLAFRLGKPQSDTSVPFYKMLYAAYLEYETDKPALPLRGNRAPEYPDALRERRIEGEVLVQFVVDTMGRADMRTFRLLGPRRVYREFVESVINALPKMRFSPAERRGCKVKQLVQLPFAFKLRW